MKAECNLHWKAAMVLKHHSFLSVFVQLYLGLYLWVSVCYDVAIRFWSSAFWLILSVQDFISNQSFSEET